MPVGWHWAEMPVKCQWAEMPVGSREKEVFVANVEYSRNRPRGSKLCGCKELDVLDWGNSM